MNKPATPAKAVLCDVLHAHCLYSQNIDEVIRLAGVSESIYNGKRNYSQIRELILRAMSEEKAREILNQMPFPFIEDWSWNYDKHQSWIKAMFPDMNQVRGASTFKYFKDKVLRPLPAIPGYQIENSEGFAEFIIRVH